MFPISDDDSQRRTLPVVTYALVGLNGLAFLLELSAARPRRPPLAPRSVLFLAFAPFASSCLLDAITQSPFLMFIGKSDGVLTLFFQ
jgi:hypothetical protein